MLGWRLWGVYLGFCELKDGFVVVRIGGLVGCCWACEARSGGEEQLSGDRRSLIESRSCKVLVLKLDAAMRRWMKECSVETGDAGEYISSLC